MAVTALLSSSSQAQDAGPIQNMAELLDSVEPMKPLRRGDVVEGVMMRVDSEGILVSIGHKAEGLVPSREMKTLSSEDFERLRVGDEIVTFVIRESTDDSSAILSIDKAVGQKAWKILQNFLEQGEGVEGKIMGFNRGGAIVEVESIQGFVPMSQLVSISRELFNPEHEDSEQDPKTDEIGKVLQLKILEIDRARNRAIFSERQALQEVRDEQKAKLIKELQEGEIRPGKVTGISSFGAFVDLGGADGLIHISELSWNSVTSTEDVVKVGQELDVYVLKVDAENKKIALSLRRLEPEPWETITRQFDVGDVVDATITKLTNFGAFARVEGSVEGLIHISELDSRVINHPREVVGEGDIVKLKVLRIEIERRRLGLSLKQAVEEAETEES